MHNRRRKQKNHDSRLSNINFCAGKAARHSLTGLFSDGGVQKEIRRVMYDKHWLLGGSTVNVASVNLDFSSITTGPEE